MNYLVLFKKRILLLIILVFSISQAFPQSRFELIKSDANGFSAKLYFESIPFSVSESQQRKVSFKNSINESLPGSFALPEKIIYVAIPPFSKLNLRSISESTEFIQNVIPEINPKTLVQGDSVVKYEKIDYAHDIAHNSNEKNDFSILGYTWIKNYYVAVIKVKTHKYDFYEKQISAVRQAEIRFDISEIKEYERYDRSSDDENLNDIISNYDYAKEYRSKPKFITDNPSAWIDYSKEYLKISTYTDGIYRITFNDIKELISNKPFVDSKTLKLFKRGKQIPIYLSDGNDGKFDNDDWFEFYSEKNYEDSDYKKIVNSGEPYINYMNKYTDTSYVWLTWDGNTGQRTIVKEKPAINGIEYVNSHLSKIHLEDDKRFWYYTGDNPRHQHPYWQENKVFTWLFISGTGTSTIQFNVQDFEPSSIANITTRLISNASNINKNAHKMVYSLNSTTPTDTILFDFNTTVNFVAKSSSNNLISGNNKITLYGLPTQANPNQVLIDWVDIEYLRKNRAVKDSLVIEFPNTLVPGTKNIKVENIQNLDNLIVYKIKPVIEKIISFTKDYSTKSIIFCDTISASTVYLITNNSLIQKPSFIQTKSFKKIITNSINADYLIISSKIFQSSTETYSAFINDKYNVNTFSAYIDDIYDEYSYGYPEPESIKKYLIDISNKSASLKLRNLLLIGDANYDYKTKWNPLPTTIKKNYVPSFGQPVSDVWFTILDTSLYAIPQLNIGRIPIRQNDELLKYLDRHKKYLDKEYDLWNKTFLLFSGGDPKNVGEINELKNANDKVFNYSIADSVGAKATHYYKTINPLSNYGPYPQSKFNNSIDSGAVFISYVGHSGTRTWDNGINETRQLKNKFDNSPLISDFGCSTGRFAEPDVDAFGELFVAQSNDGQAIAYIGNSNLGYLSTATRFPSIFYKELLSNTNETIGDIHFKAKLEQLNDFGYNDLNMAFTFCNLLFGDPLIKIKIPESPNFVLTKNDVEMIDQEKLSDNLDSVKIKIKIWNWGRGVVEKIKVLVSDVYNNKKVFDKIIELPKLALEHDLICSIPIRNMPGEHSIKVMVDSENKIYEYNENDNQLDFNFSIASSQIKSLCKENYFLSGDIQQLSLLNPTVIDKDELNSIELLLADNQEFNQAIMLKKNLDPFYTKIKLENLLSGKRYWWKSRLAGSSHEWSNVSSFLKTNKVPSWSIDSTVFDYTFEKENVQYDSVAKGWSISQELKKLVIISAGSSDGKYASITLNGKEILSNTFFWGIATAVLDTSTLTPKDIRFFTYPTPQSTDSLTKYLNQLPTGTRLIMTVCDDAAQSVLGFSLTTNIRKLIGTFGSAKIDSVGYRESWCMIGIKGAPKGSIMEVYRKQFQGIASIELDKNVNNQSGHLVTPMIKNAKEWGSIELKSSLPQGSKLEIIPIVVDKAGSLTSLDEIIFQNGSSNLSQISAEQYPSIYFKINFTANELNISPVFQSLNVQYKGLPELGTNYQVASISSDTLTQGESGYISFRVYNTGESKADKFKILVELIRNDNTRENVSEILVDSIASESYREFKTNFITSSFSGNGNIIITIDNENKINELFKENNTFSLPIYVKPNKSPAVLKLAIDGNDILNGDFISATPKIEIELDDYSLLPISDTNHVKIMLNNKRISFKNDAVKYFFSESNPKLKVVFTPLLSDGKYNLNVTGKNASGVMIDSSGITRNFVVNTTPQLLNVYNYPNPFSSDTYFTFKLSQIPDELTIKIYTLTGRLIKEIKLSSYELNYDFNRIFWDGRDEDGDLAANGIYLYKILLSKENKIISVNQKLAIVR